MCQSVYENAHVERVNGTIKNQYLMHWNITSFAQMKKMLKRAVDTYNSKKPHDALEKVTPVEFEKHISMIKKEDRPQMRIWTENISSFKDENQYKIPF